MGGEFKMSLKTPTFKKEPPMKVKMPNLLNLKQIKKTLSELNKEDFNRLKSDIKKEIKKMPQELQKLKQYMPDKINREIQTKYRELNKVIQKKIKEKEVRLDKKIQQVVQKVQASSGKVEKQLAQYKNQMQRLEKKCISFMEEALKARKQHLKTTSSSRTPKRKKRKTTTSSSSISTSSTRTPNATHSAPTDDKPSSLHS